MLVEDETIKEVDPGKKKSGAVDYSFVPWRLEERRW